MGNINMLMAKHESMINVWRQRVMECKTSGLTVAEWCEQNHINKKTCLSYVKGSDVGTIYIEDRVYQGLKDNGNMERMILLHELGHFFYHHQVNKATSTSQIDQVRLDAISNGKIYEDEKQADEFAAGYIGFRAAANGLEELKQESVAKYGNREYDPDEVALSIKELELRIQHLRHLESSGQANRKSGR